VQADNLTSTSNSWISMKYSIYASDGVDGNDIALQPLAERGHLA
jgi:hypothetical protein